MPMNNWTGAETVQHQELQDKRREFGDAQFIAWLTEQKATWDMNRIELANLVDAVTTLALTTAHRLVRVPVPVAPANPWAANPWESEG